MKMKLVAILTVISVGLLTACGGGAAPTAGGGGAATEAQIRVASVFHGPINDGAFIETQYNGLRRMEARGAQVSFVENVSSADFVEAMRAFAAEGFDLVIAGTNAYEDIVFPVSEDFPDVRFVIMNGIRHMSDNLISVRIPNEEQGFLAAVVAALTTETGTVGFVGGMDITPIIGGSYGFQQGVDYVNEIFGTNVSTIRINTGSFTDVHQAKETALSMIESGADVVVPMADAAGMGVIEAVEERGVKSVGTGPGHVVMAPNNVIATIMRDNAYVYDALWEMLVNDDWPTDEIMSFGIQRGVTYTQDWIDDIDPQILEMVYDIIGRVNAGEMTIRTTF